MSDNKEKTLLSESHTLTAHAETLVEKWSPVLSDAGAPKIVGDYKTAAIAQMLENQSESNRQSGLMNEDTPTNVTGGAAKWDPVLINMVRRSAPSLIAFDIAGVQPMSGPTGLIFAMRARYNTQSGTEALFNEANSAFSGQGSQSNGLFAGVATGDLTGTTFAAVDASKLSVGMLAIGSGIPDGTTIAGIAGNNVTLSAAGTDGTNVNLAFAASYGEGVDVAIGEGDIIPEMAFSIEKKNVEAVTRSLKATYSHELATDLRAIHRLDADGEMINVLQSELLAEQNREFMRKMYAQAKIGSVGATNPGQYDLVLDADGRWSQERFKGLHYQIEKEANRINIETRRGKGNILIASADVVSALAFAKILDTNGLDINADTNWNGNLYVGNIGRMKVFIDPYAQGDFFWVGYKGASPWDAGYYFCPYTQFVLLRGQDPKSLQPIVAFKTRYGTTANPFFSGGTRQNAYYRISSVIGV